MSHFLNIYKITDINVKTYTENCVHAINVIKGTVIQIM